MIRCLKANATRPASAPWPETSARIIAVVPSGRRRASHQSPARTPSAERTAPTMSRPSVSWYGRAVSCPRSAETTGLCWDSASVAPRVASSSATIRRRMFSASWAIAATSGGPSTSTCSSSRPAATRRIRPRSALTGPSTQRRSSSAPTARTRASSNQLTSSATRSRVTAPRSPRCAWRVRASMSRSRAATRPRTVSKARLPRPDCTSSSARDRSPLLRAVISGRAATRRQVLAAASTRSMALDIAGSPRKPARSCASSTRSWVLPSR